MSTAARPVALVTGVSRGIGAAIASELGMARTRPADFAGEFVAVDLTDTKAAAQAFIDVVGRHKVLRLVNNAGIVKVSEMGAIPGADYDIMMDLNVRAPMLAIQAVLPGMRDARFGRIVNIGSRAALGKEGRGIYGATKAALLSLTRTTALENAQYGITSNCIAPGPIETEMFEANYPKGSPQLAAFIRQVPLARMGRPAEIAHACGYFLDDRASFTTGQVLYVCGGMSIGQVPI
jgi:3-oxoacyl-[acyl-carrier protein] reductase